MKILAVTCWSHKIKYYLLSTDGHTILASGIIERVGLDGSFICQSVPGREPISFEMDNDDHQSAMALIISTLTDPKHGVITSASKISAVGHRVAHGGKEFSHSVQIDEQVLNSIRHLQHLAPLHSVPNILGIEAAMTLMPSIPHVAIFDTAFHLSMPECAYVYPLPYEWHEKHGVRRYGFHGPSHLYLSRRAAALLGKPIEACNLITIHLDRGVSLCAIRNGRSVDTSMGMTPLEGVVMETRCGDIDAGIHSYMMSVLNLSTKELELVLNNRSGVFGITGQHLERRHYVQAALEGTPRCKLALEIETYRLKKYIGSYLAIAGPLDAIIFTSGSGAAESTVREMVLSGLDIFGIRLDQNINRALRAEHEEAEITGPESLVRTFIIPTNEELVIAEDVAAILSGDCIDYSFANSDFVPSASMR